MECTKSLNMKKIAVIIYIVFATLSYSFAQNILNPPIMVQDGNNCFGLDCLLNDTYDIGTVLKLRQNNLRLEFNDTSTPTFPNNDWVIGANDTNIGGRNMFFIQDKTAGKIPFQVMAGAADSAFVLSSNGLRLNVPDGSNYNLHMVSGDSPRIRFEQTDKTWLPYTWDIFANDLGFHIRDVSNNKIPFEITPGAPENAFIIRSTRISIKNDLSLIGAFTMISGNLSIRDSAKIEGNLTVLGDITVGSDRRLKKNIQSFDGGLEKIMAMQVKRYQYHWEKYPELNLSKDNKIGLIAQEVEEIIPEVVSNSIKITNQSESEENLKAVNYVGLVPVLIKAVQEQQKQIGAQQEQLTKLELENQQLEQQLQRIHKLEAMMAQLLEKGSAPPHMNQTASN